MSGQPKAAAPASERAALFEAPDDVEAINRLYCERRWSDGLPIIPPTIERVERMLARTRRSPGEIVAKVAPGFGAATVPIALAATRVLPNAVRLGTGAGSPAEQSALARAVFVEEEPCAKSVATSPTSTATSKRPSGPNSSSMPNAGGLSFARACCACLQHARESSPGLARS